MKHFLFVFFSFVCLIGCAPKLPENKVTLQERKVLSTIETLKTGHASGPIQLTFRKLELEEISTHLQMDKETTEAHLLANHVHGYYSLTAKNYPPGEEFILYQIDLSQHVHPTKTFYVNDHGLLVTLLDDLYVNLENNYLYFANYLPGEPADFVLGSKSGKYFAAVSIVPNPIVARDERNRVLSAQLQGPDRRHYLIHGMGLEPCVSYRLITDFEGEKRVFDINSNLNGEIFQTVGPTVDWVRGGNANLELRGSDLKSPLFLQFEWGFN